MTITIAAFERSPDGKGLARDTRGGWVLKEVVRPYAVRLVSFAAMTAPAHLARHPSDRSRSGLLDEYSNLSAYVARGEAKPACKRAFAAQLAVDRCDRAAG